MAAMGSRSLVLFLLSVLLQSSPLLSYCLKNCTVGNPHNVSEVRVECAGRGLAAVPDDVPRHAASLDLSSNQIVKISRGDVSGLSQLRDLNLNKNNISHIEDGALLDLVQLTHLSVDYNHLTQLTDHMFQGLSRLTYLSLHLNQITSISHQAFQPLVSLKTLVLRFNFLRRVSDVVTVLQLQNLQELDLAQNSFSSFRSDELPVNMSNLRTLQLNSNPLRKFSVTTDFFPHLESLRLSECSSDFEWDVSNKTFLRSLRTLHLSGADAGIRTYRRMLQSTDALEHLSLSFMKLSLDEGLVDFACQLPALTKLNLSCNFVGRINDKLMQNCSELTELNLSDNDLTELSEFSLRSMQRLKCLGLHRNRLSRVPAAVRGVSALEVLNLSHNFIPELSCSDFQNLTTLTELNLNHNHISVLRSCVFHDLNELKVLHAAHNAIYSFHDSFRVRLQKLQVLDLRSNDFNKLRADNFGNLSSLRSLALDSETHCFAAVGAFQGLSDLQTLSVSPFAYRHGLFTGLQLLENLQLNQRFEQSSVVSMENDESSFFHLPSLKRLKVKNYNKYSSGISGTLLRGLESLEHLAAERFFVESPHPDTFSYTPHLKSLQIIQTNLSDLRPELFESIPNLQTLDLSRNKLRSVDFLLRANLSALSRLTLSHNELMVINEAVLQSLPALTYLDLVGNPFTCDCSNTGFIQWVKSNNQTQVVHAFRFDCFFPLSKKGTRLLDFDPQSCWMDVSFLCFLCSTCLVVLTLLSSFVHHFLRWQLVYACYLFLAFLYDSRKRKKGAPHRYDAFVSYNLHDEAWVCGEMLPVLEAEQGWRLCLHHRDFQPGKPVIDNITDAIYGSRKTICVLSRRYLQSDWCSREIQMASFRLFDEQKDVLILLFLENIPSRLLSPYHRMRKLVKRRTYLVWPEAGRHPGLFWQNVRRALETGDAAAETSDLLTGPRRH
ncbi:toll-like receptor 13 isoform X1 [Scophthalmus maximus]|uniref:toll-like receptor 13 isoform X1 n=1 Tax=Scophthalmus maximus TaxID=52904 RepID=UPI001FA88C2C|nr:toll-like receptor 13 isoform X1 [Scophthalmus maximus]XP_047186055.1 toll-like receptor 13 isoform X1 [Scophthalmus maximus]